MARDIDRWEQLASWWTAELAGDPAYRDEVAPLVLSLTSAGGTVLDVGCGDGRLMSELAERGAHPIGVDISKELLSRAARYGQVVRGELPALGYLRDGVVDGAVVSLVLEHLEDHQTLLSELARVARPGAYLSLVVNHPIYTAPDSGPITDTDGEVLWRPGEYFGTGYSDEPAGEGTVRFHHRPLGTLLTDAAQAGWSLERMVEQGVTASQVERYPLLANQRHVPRLLGVRWTRR